MLKHLNAAEPFSNTCSFLIRVIYHACCRSASNIYFQHTTYVCCMYVCKFTIKALHGRLVGRFKPPLAGRCNDFAPSRQKNCHRQKQPSRPGPRKKKKNTAPPRPVEKKKKTTPSRLGKKKQPPRPASEKKTTAPSRLEKKTNPPRPAMNSKIQNTPPRGWKLETNTTACLFFSLSCCTFISYCSLVQVFFSF